MLVIRIWMEKFIEINKRGIVIIFLEERYRCKEFVEIPAYFSSAFIIREDVFFALHIGSALVLCVYDWTMVMIMHGLWWRCVTSYYLTRVYLKSWSPVKLYQGD